MKNLFVTAVFYLLMLGASLSAHAENVRLIIPQGSSVKAIARQLDDAGIIASPFLFEVTVRLKGQTGAMRAGEFEFSKEDGMFAAIEKIVKNEAVQHRLTLPEGLTVRDVLALLRADERLTGEVPDQIEEGSLYPETYTFTRGQSRESLVRAMQNAMNKAVDEAWSALEYGVPVQDKQELVTLASIIEKETALEHERTTVASVFVNRLRTGMRLQADPTVIYGLSDYDGNIRRRDLENPHPYNTYRHAGLPPTPIANPSKASLMAAARPAQTSYYYFVATGDGGHVFAETHEEHVKNVQNYLKVLRTRAN